MWWSEDSYGRDVLVPSEIVEHAGPNDVALVGLRSDGKTDPGWGEQRFMANYNRGQFSQTRVLVSGRYVHRTPFAFVMRSLRLVCIDIDGKNGGLEHVGKLGMLPYTLAETSKSGNGYHLFYSTGEDRWDDQAGFAQFRDRIGIQQGVDFRATGCVFHWPSQRWNARPVAELPQHLKDRLLQKYAKEEAIIATIVKTLENGDEAEILVMQDTLIDDLRKPIPAGRRNVTLYAVGSQMMLAKVPDWENRVWDRAIALGLDRAEAHKILNNIEKYGANA